MFKSLLKSVFPSLSNARSAPNFTYFESEKSAEEIAREQSIELLNEQLSNSELLPVQENIQAQFLNYLFGESGQGATEDSLSLFVADKIELLLTKKPSLIIKSLPVMPNTMVMLTQELQSGEFDTNVLIEAINREPSIAADVIKLANTVKYRRGQKDITDLKAAFMAMGAKGLMEGVIQSYLKNFTPAANVYFKQFGDNIWQHSQQCAELTQAIMNVRGEPELSATAYLVGLIRNIGQMIIFQLMVDAFSCVNPDSSPATAGFKRLISQYSLKLTYTIAKVWQLPDFIIRAIKLQINAENSQQLVKYQSTDLLALIGYEASLLSELISLKDCNRITEEVYEEHINAMVLTNDIKQVLAVN